MLLIHLELLDKKRRKTFEKLEIFKKDAVLAGGTALCLQIGHRLSFDFDLFLQRKIKRSDFLKLKKYFGIKTTEINIPEQLTIITPENISITLAYYNYKPLFKKVSTGSVPLFSIKDISADKAFTIGRRATWRDYVDLFFILKEKHTNIPELVKMCQKKFEVEFNPKLFLEQLVFFKDIEFTKTSFIKKQYSSKEIKEFLIAQVTKFKKSELKI